MFFEYIAAVRDTVAVWQCLPSGFGKTPKGSQVYFRILNNGQSGELTYLLGDLEAREAVLIDPHGCDLTVLSAVLAEHELRLRWVLRTHHHDDLFPNERHTLERLGAPIVQGDNLAAQALTDGSSLPFGYEQIRVLKTPGHTHFCLSFVWRDRLFCGGLLAVTDCPQQPYPAAPDLLWDSVTQRVFVMPDETLLFASHEPRARAVSTVLEQRCWHPMLAAVSRDEFLAHIAALPQSKLSPSLT